MENAIERIVDQPVSIDARVNGALHPSAEVLRSPAKLQAAPRRVDAPAWAWWPTAFWFRRLRGLIQRAFIFPLLSLTFRLRAVGLHNLDGLDAPTIFAANHAHPADHLLILQALPRAVRGRMAIAAGAEQWGTWGRGVLYPLVGNGFPLVRYGPIRSSLQYVAHVLSDGWSVLIFPEGRLTKGGPMQPFKGGVGFCAAAMEVRSCEVLQFDRFGEGMQVHVDPVNRRIVAEPHVAGHQGFIYLTARFDDPVSADLAAELI